MKLLSYPHYSYTVPKNFKRVQQGSLDKQSAVQDNPGSPQSQLFSTKRREAYLDTSYRMALSSRTALRLSRLHADILSKTHEAAGRDKTKPGYGGNCTLDEYDKLEDKKKELCNEAASLGKCGGTPDSSKLAAWGRCARARENVMNKCFNGGDYNHRKAAIDMWKAANNCGN